MPCPNASTNIRVRKMIAAPGMIQGDARKLAFCPPNQIVLNRGLKVTGCRFDGCLTQYSSRTMCIK
jgi:hypothetical protein